MPKGARHSGFFSWAKHNASKYAGISIDEMYEIYLSEMRSVGVLDYIIPHHSQSARRQPLAPDVMGTLDLGQKLRTSALGVSGLPYGIGTVAPLLANTPGPTMAYTMASNYVATTPWAAKTAIGLGYGLQGLTLGTFMFGSDETRAVMMSSPGGAEAIISSGGNLLYKGYSLHKRLINTTIPNRLYQLKVWLRTRHLPQVTIGDETIAYLEAEGNIVHVGNDVALTQLRLTPVDKPGNIVVARNLPISPTKNIKYFPSKKMPRVYAIHEYSHGANYNTLGKHEEEVRAWKELLEWDDVMHWTKEELNVIYKMIQHHMSK